MSLLLKVLVTFLLLPLICLSGVRLFSQFIIPTDLSSLWATPSPATYYRPEILPSALKQLTVLDPLSSDYKTLLARSLMTTNNPSTEESIRRAIDVSVVNPEGWVLSGMFQGKPGRIESGAAAFEKAVSLNPSRPATYLEQGLYLFDALPSVPVDLRALYRNLADLSLNVSLNLDPALIANPRLCLAMAEVAAEKGHTGRAVSWLKRAVVQPPVNWPFAIKKMALCFSLGEGVEALSTWKNVFVPKNLSSAQLGLIETEIKKYPIPDFAYFLADLYVFQGKLDFAQEELASLVAVRPNVAHYRMALGDVYEKLQRYREARLCYEKALELSPANQEAKRKVMEYYGRR